MPKISVIIPAHNEERFIGGCLESVAAAAGGCGCEVEVIVVLNRCTDTTASIASWLGAVTVVEDARNLAAIRNAGAAAARGDILVTIDADSTMTANMLSEVASCLAGDKFIGGGVRVKFDRSSLGIRMSDMFLRTMLFFTGLSGGLYWCRKADFDAIGGFNESLPFGEDLDFAKRLRKLGRQRGLRYHTINSAWITTSCRKFDHFGDWYFFRLIFFHSKKLKNAMRGEDPGFTNEYFYDFDNNQPPQSAASHSYKKT